MLTFLPLKERKLYDLSEIADKVNKSKNQSDALLDTFIFPVQVCFRGDSLM